MPPGLPQISLLYISIPNLKDWRLGVDICFERNNTEFCVLTIFEVLLNGVIKFNKIQVPEEIYPLLYIPYNSIMLNLLCDLRTEKPIRSNQGKPNFMN